MDNGLESLLLFYGIFWATTISTSGRYRAFDTAAMFRGGPNRRAIFRFVVGLLVMNVAPILALFALYNYPQFFNLNISGTSSIVAAAIVSLSAFSWIRLLHAITATRKTWQYFYSNEEWSTVLDQSGHAKSDSLLLHLWGWVAYLVFPLSIAWFVGGLCCVA